MTAPGALHHAVQARRRLGQGWSSRLLQQVLLGLLTSATAREYASVGVRVNGIVCGTFDTDAAAGLTQNPDMLQGILSSVALGRVGRPDEVVGAVVYLLSDASSYTTASLMTIDGGVAG